ncbi:MAG: hypothetical protein ACD_19C00227G0001 [uncultured bacterium]|nr:MAG: hypothetical protein ACD_19C00227G0001 [uncultured bacterium]
MLLGTRIAGDFGATLFVPVILFAWLGKILDNKYDLWPILTIIGFVLAAILSSIMIYRKAQKYNAEYLAIDGKEIKEIPKE